LREYVSYDIEIYEDLPEDFNGDLRGIHPSVAAFCIDTEKVYYYDDAPESPIMKKETAQKLVRHLTKGLDKGYIPFGWNSLHFDFQILAHHSGMYEECGRLALNHVDGMFLIICKRGHFLGLDKVLKGASIESKVHIVNFNDGSEYKDMDGSKAPLLWRQGEYSAVREYLAGDVIQPLKLINRLDKTKSIKWVSGKGKNNTVNVEMLTVKEALNLPFPNTSWMEQPPNRQDFYSWIPMEVLKKEGVLKDDAQDSFNW